MGVAERRWPGIPCPETTCDPASVFDAGCDPYKYCRPLSDLILATISKNDYRDAACWVG